MVSSPKPPDPVAAAKAQGAASKEAAIAQYGLEATDRIGPDGTTRYTQGSTWSDGTPHYTQTTKLSPAQQLIYDLGNQNEVKLGGLAGTQLDKLDTLLGTPININNEATESRLMELGRKRLDPLWQERNAALETSLLNRGIRPGSENYATLHRQAGEQENDDYNSLLLSGREQAVNEALKERNQPINEITALMSGSQVSQPGAVNAPAPGVAPADVIGLINNNYNAQVQNANAKWGALGSLAGAAGTAFGGWLRSDRRAKKDITRIGDDPRGWGVYLFQYIGREGWHTGYMADEVEPIRPDAVAVDGEGFKMINYAALR